MWFPRKERVMSTTIGVNMSIVGNMLGFYLPLYFVTSDSEGEVGSIAYDDAIIDIRN